jgi:hypothetical protein
MLTPRTSEFCTMLNTPACSTFQSHRLLSLSKSPRWRCLCGSLNAKSAFSLDLEFANSGLGSARALPYYTSPARTFGASPKSFFIQPEKVVGEAPPTARSLRSPEERRHSAALRYEMEFRQAEYFRDRGATPAPSKSIHQETLLSVRQNVHRATFRLRQKFCRHIQN